MICPYSLAILSMQITLLARHMFLPILTLFVSLLCMLDLTLFVSLLCMLDYRSAIFGHIDHTVYMSAGKCQSYITMTDYKKMSIKLKRSKFSDHL